MPYVITAKQMQTVLAAPATYAAFNFLNDLKPHKKTWRDSRIEKLETALRLVMDCAGDVQAATDAELEGALSCGDPDTEKQANAWLVARAALLPDNAVAQRAASLTHQPWTALLKIAAKAAERI